MDPSTRVKPSRRDIARLLGPTRSRQALRRPYPPGSNGQIGNQAGATSRDSSVRPGAAKPSVDRTRLGAMVRSETKQARHRETPRSDQEPPSPPSTVPAWEQWSDRKPSRRDIARLLGPTRSRQALRRPYPPGSNGQIGNQAGATSRDSSVRPGAAKPSVDRTRLGAMVRSETKQARHRETPRSDQEPPSPPSTVPAWEQW